MDRDALSRFKETILKDYPKLSLEDNFCFSCHSGLKCFNECCKDVNIFLTPYDILRMKKRLGMTSDEFLGKYTKTLAFDEKGMNTVTIKMGEDDEKRCPFVTEEGCTIYEDRPWSCRMYPLGMASPNKNYTSKDEFYFLVTKEDFPFCKGLDESKDWSVKDWRVNEGIDIYDEKSKSYKDIVMHDFFQKNNILTVDKAKVFHMACYNLDQFREFLFGSSFFDKFEVDEETKSKIKEDDEALLDFGYKWLKFSLFGEDTMKIKDEVAERAREKAELAEEEKGKINES